MSAISDTSDWPVTEILLRRIPVLAAALWWGSLSAIGFVAVPMLFAHLPTPAMAGQMAAKLFAAQTYISIAACACLLVLSKQKHAEKTEEWAQAAIVFVILGLLLALRLPILPHAPAPAWIAPRLRRPANLRGLGSRGPPLPL